MGILKPKKSDIIQFPIEITSVEIKLEPTQLITAFGQACAYRLFSHRVYLVIPEKSSKEEIDRLDSLSSLFGIGLILYDSDSVEKPNYQIVTRAAKQEPDFFYANKNLKLIEDDLVN